MVVLSSYPTSMLTDTLITKEDFELSKCEEVLDGISKKECSAYSTELSRRVSEYNKKGEKNIAYIFALLSTISSFHFNPENSLQPFSPLFQILNTRALMSEDLTENNIESLKIIVDLIKDPEIKARISDVIWIVKHDHIRAKQAVEAYLLSARNLEDPKNWPPFKDRVERALRLAITLQNKGLMEVVFAFIETTLKNCSKDNFSFLPLKLMELLIEFKHGEPQEYISISESFIVQAKGLSDWNKTRDYLYLKIKWHELAGEKEKIKDGLIEGAKTYVSQAEEQLMTDPPSNFLAAKNLQSAIEALRRIGGQKNFIDELHKKLLLVQSNIPSEMESFSIDINIGEIIARSRKRVTEKDFNESIRILALSYQPPSILNLEKDLRRYMARFPMQYIFSNATINKDGKTIARRPHLNFGGNNQEDESTIRTLMYEHASRNHQIFDTQGIIEPMQRQIRLDHRGAPDDFMNFVINNPFIPSGRELLYARALSAGLRGDLVDFLSIACPQIENSIRYVLLQKGVVTSSLDSEGIQKEFDLNHLLFMPEVKKIFGEDLAFDLQGLLVVHAGTNLRNIQAHGLLDFENHYSLSVLYFWWILLRIVVIGFINIQKIEAHQVVSTAVPPPDMIPLYKS